MGPDVLLVLVIILIIVLIWQGPKNLPKLGGALGRSIKDFKTEVSDDPSKESTTATPMPPKDEPGS